MATGGRGMEEGEGEGLSASSASRLWTKARAATGVSFGTRPPLPPTARSDEEPGCTPPLFGGRSDERENTKVTNAVPGDRNRRPLSPSGVRASVSIDCFRVVCSPPSRKTHALHASLSGAR